MPVLPWVSQRLSPDGESLVCSRPLDELDIRSLITGRKFLKRPFAMVGFSTRPTSRPPS